MVFVSALVDFEVDEVEELEALFPQAPSRTAVVKKISDFVICFKFMGFPPVYVCSRMSVG